MGQRLVSFPAVEFLLGWRLGQHDIVPEALLDLFDDLASYGRDVLIIATTSLGQGPQLAPIPEAAAIVNIDSETHPQSCVQQGDHAEVSAEEVLVTAMLRTSGIQGLRLAVSRPHARWIQAQDDRCALGAEMEMGQEARLAVHRQQRTAAT